MILPSEVRIRIFPAAVFRQDSPGECDDFNLFLILLITNCQDITLPLEARAWQAIEMQDPSHP